MGIIKVAVVLGYGIASNIDSWSDSYKNDEVNDTLPYGYDRANDDRINVEYVKLNKFENGLLFNKYLKYAYLYYIKLPLLLFKYDVIWTHYDNDALYIARLRGIPFLNKYMPKQIANFVWLVDNSKAYNDRKIKYISKLLNRIEKIIYHSNSETNKFIDVFETRVDKLQHVHFGINFDAYSDEKPVVKPKSVANYKEYILSVGSDVHRDIELLDNLACEFPNKVFVLCTCNPHYLTKQYKSKNMTVLSANLSEMRYLYANCSCVIIPLKYNEHVSGCTTLLEAAAMKKPVIITEVPGIRDYVVENETALLVPINNLELFSTALDKLESNKEDADTMGKNAYNYCSKRFTTDKWAHEHARLTLELYD